MGGVALHTPGPISVNLVGDGVDSNPTPDTTVANSRPPACDRPRNSNRDRVAHHSDNSVVTLLGTTARSQSRVGV